MPTLALTRQTFEEAVSRSHIALVKFWTDWCGVCTHFAPVYEESSNLHPDIVFGTVDAEAERPLAATARVSAYPTTLGFREGLLVYSYAGYLNSAELEDVVQQIMWLDMDQVRQNLADRLQTVTPPPPEPVGVGPRGAGLARGPARYGWPRLRTR
ncbi:thioredoxin family protein [Nocardia terpenica]|uniref:Thiol reductase thioredoxin n=1 Tax=Nocardia terpenica TaxID=455432 RepID=A0A6G9YZJ0_9NOCA|nr:thioredoxin family protein [Nocardia terpenica]QIS18634.1 thiol reductase thioredoxin [Nocardia terpenica]